MSYNCNNCLKKFSDENKYLIHIHFEKPCKKKPVPIKKGVCRLSCKAKLEMEIIQLRVQIDQYRENIAELAEMLLKEKGIYKGSSP